MSRRLLHLVNDVVDNTPVAGHVKAGYHQLDGDKRAASKSVHRANRTTVVAGATCAGAAVGGKVGAVVAGTVAASTYDGK